jgi:hypothetical protein
MRHGWRLDDGQLDPRHRRRETVGRDQRIVRFAIDPVAQPSTDRDNCRLRWAGATLANSMQAMPQAPAIAALCLLRCAAR